MYPFPEDDVRAVLGRYKNATEFIWVQEEPANMGALSFVDAAPEADSRLQAAQHQARRQLDPGDRLGQGPRTGAENTDYAGLGQTRMIAALREIS